MNQSKKRSGVHYRKEEKKQDRLSILKEDRQALGLFVAKYADKKEAFSYPLTTYPLSPNHARNFYLEIV